jgi:uncharacterized caspase-like protein
MRAGIIAAALAAQIAVCQTAFARQERGGGVRVARVNADGSKREAQLYEGSYALVIGNSEYTLGWDRLSGVKNDVVAVREILERHGFTVEVAENLTSEQFGRRVRKFINDYGYDRDNRLIIYYAGHGYTLNSAGDKRELGYIIPSDTPLPARDVRGFRQKAVNMYAIQTFARDIQAKHALFVFDSCFSGKLFALRGDLKVAPFIVEKVERSVRQFITAGDETQAVRDDSVFRKAFVRGLEGDADMNDDTYITGTELAEFLKEVVTNSTERGQTPQFGTINDIDLNGGDFVFAAPKTSAADSKNGAGNASRADAAAVEKEYWEAIRNSTEVEDFRLYKEKYPNGLYVNLADLKIRQLTRIVVRRRATPSSTPSNTSNNRANTPTVTENVELSPFKDAGGKYGYKNKTSGAVVIAPKYDAAYSFYQGLANVMLNHKEGYINKRGEVVIPLKYDYVSVQFSEGLSAVRLGAKYGYIDKNGGLVIPFKYDGAAQFAGGLARVKLGDKFGFIDKSDRVVIPLKYEEMGTFSEGLVRAKLNGKWGFVNATDGLVIPFKYDYALPFHDGLAVVKLNGKEGCIDKVGGVVVPLKYDDVSGSFREGLTWVKLNGKYGFIDKTNRVVIPIKYDGAYSFSGGKAKVKLGGREFYIDKNGNEVAPNILAR